MERVLRIERLIEEVKKRPQLYDTSLGDFSNRVLKPMLWEEIAIEIFAEEWHTLGAKRKGELIRKLTTKWKSIRDQYRREIRMAREGSLKPKKKKYVYTDLLQFLDTHLKTIQTVDEEDSFEDTLLASYKQADIEIEDELKVPKQSRVKEEFEIELDETEVDLKDLQKRKERKNTKNILMKSLPIENTHIDNNTINNTNTDNNFHMDNIIEDNIPSDYHQMNNHMNNKQMNNKLSNNQIDGIQIDNGIISDEMVQLLRKIQTDQSGDSMGNKSFLMSLVPLLNKMDSDTVIDVRLGIMQVIRNCQTKSNNS